MDDGYEILSVGAKKKSKRESWERNCPPPTVTLPPAPEKPIKHAPKPLITTPPVDLDALGDAEIERVLKAIIFFDGRRVLDEDGNGLPLSMLDDATALGLAGFEVQELYENGEDGPRINVGVLKKFKQSDRARAAETLWKKQGKMGGTDENSQRNRSKLDELESVFKAGPVKK